MPRTLKALSQQNHGWFEIIVVANGCSDRTVEVARRKCHRVIVLPQKSLGIARNLGARMARGELLLFLDADTLLGPNALRRIAARFASTDAAGTLKGKPDQPRVAYRLLYGLKNLLHRLALHPGSSGVIVCWKEHFVRSGGFDEQLEVRENSELMRRLKRYGSYRYLGEITATTSMRRFEKFGMGRIAWLWLKVWAQSLLGDLHQRHYETVR